MDSPLLGAQRARFEELALDSADAARTTLVALESEDGELARKQSGRILANCRAPNYLRNAAPDRFSRPHVSLEPDPRVARLGRLSGGGKHPMLIDASQVKSGSITRKARQFAAGEECSKVTTALAVSSRSTIVKIFVNAFMTFLNPPFPTKLFL